MSRDMPESNTAGPPDGMRTLRCDTSRSGADGAIDPPSAIAEETLRAYRETHYRVLDEPETILLVNTPCPALAALHRRHGVDRSAFITACNPSGILLDAAENARRQAALGEAIAARGLASLPGIGQHPDGGWPGEPSALVLGLGLGAARELGRRFEQNAIVWCGADARPRLIMLR